MTPAGTDPQAKQARRDVWPAMRRGFLGGCPCCGKGRMFRGFLKVADACPACAEALHHHRADDLPAYLVILIVGHILIAPMVYAALETDWPEGPQMALWPALAVVLSIGLIQPVKGAVVGLQWALRMHGFGEAEAGEAR